MKYSIVLSMLTLLMACAPVPQSPSDFEPATSIVGGEPVEKDSEVARSVVAIVGRTDTAKFLCTGVLISKSAVLTAGHCAENMVQGELVFSTELSTQNRRAITQTIVQPRFAETQSRLASRVGKVANSIKNWGDLALLRFQGSVPHNYQPVQIGDANTLSDGDPVLIAGYGLVDGRSETASEVLNQAAVKIKKARYSRSEFTLDAKGGKTACHGDSGGPAFVYQNNHLILVGITSRGHDEVCAKDSIFTKVSAYQDWIAQFAP